MVVAPSRHPSGARRPARVLVTDGEQRAALAVVRSVAAAGDEVHVGASDARSLAGVSRATTSSVRLPDPLAAPSAYADAVAAYVRAAGIDVIIPVGEPAVLAILAARERLSPAIVTAGSLQAFEALNDKAALAARALDVGVRFPAHEILTWGDRDAVKADALCYPLVVKPARSIGAAHGTRGKFGVMHAADAGALRLVLASVPEAAYPLLLQQRIVGPGIGVFILRWDDRIITTFAHRRLREKPPAGGVSVYAESASVDPSLVERSVRLLDDLRWQGVAMVEYKIDAATGDAYLMEINGRFWGSLQLAIDAGVDFPALLVAAALGRSTARVPAYRVGVRGRWWWGDVDQLLARLRRSDAALSLPPGAPSRATAVREFLAAGGAGGHDWVFRGADPAPFLLETVRWLRGR